MGNLLQMSITSGQDTDSRQFTLAASSHRLAGETYDANGNRTSGSSDGFTSVSYNILNLPETVTAGGRTINYLYSAAGAKLRECVILSASEESTTDYAGNTVFRDSVLHKVLTGSGYLETTDSLQTLLSHPGYRFFITDHLGSVRVVADSQGNVLQRNVFHPYGEDYAAVYAQGGNILDGLNIGSNAQPGGEGTPEGEGEPEIDDPEPGTPVGGGGPDEPIEDDGEEATADEAPLAWPQYYRSFNPYRFSAKEQMTVYGGSLVDSNFEPNAGLYDFGARWYAPYSARWSTPDPLSEKYYAISPYAYCAGNPVNLVDPDGMKISLQYTDKNGNIHGYNYTIGQEYKGDNKFFSDITQILNDIYTYGGQKAIETLSDSKNEYVYSNDRITTKNGVIVNAYDNNGHLCLGNLYEGGDYSSALETVAHETFHALQDEEGQAGRSIFHEAEAYLFGSMILTNWINNGSLGPSSDSTAGNRQDNAVGFLYSLSFKSLTLDFNNGMMLLNVISFKKGSQPNLSGTYDSLPSIKINQRKSVLQKYYPKYENN